MKNIVCGSLFFLCFTMACKTINTQNSVKPKVIPTIAQLQEKLLFKELLERNLYLGISRVDYLKNRPKALYNNDVHNFRSIYVEEDFSTRFETLICYLDNDNEEPLYEFILVLNPQFNANDVAFEHFGSPNYRDKEWRFFPSETNLPYTVAVWTYKNKIVIAATIKGTEWENGIE